MKQKFLASGLLLGLLLGMAPLQVWSASSGNVFSDVSSDSNYSQAIQYLKDKNIVQGYTDGTFGPSKSINRAEFTKILIGAINPNPQGKYCFSDVTDQWFAPYVCQAKALKVIDGYSDGSFKPDQEINFSESAKIIANAFKLNKGAQDPSVWFKTYIEALQRGNAVPLSVEYFDEKITRDEMAEIIWRIKADVKDKSSRTYAELNGDGLIKPTSCADLQERYKKFAPVRGPIYYEDNMSLMKESTDRAMPLPAMSTTSAAPAQADGGAGMSGATSDYSHTNLQVNNVDEGDIIKNDGKYIYIIKNNSIRIVQAYPAIEMKELISFELGPKDQSFYPSEMYIDGNQLTVIGSANTNYIQPLATSTAKMSAMPIRYNASRTKVYVVDISDRSKPKVTRTVDFDGTYSTSRKTNGTLYLVMNQYPNRYYYRATPASDQQSFNDLLPKMHDSLNDQESLIAPCEDIRLMPRPKSFNFLITAAIPLNNANQQVTRNVIVGSGENVYASSNNLYVASTDWESPYYDYSGTSSTKLYRFALDQGQITYKAEGTVPGTVLNQFSMDEQNGELRIVTTEENYGESTDISNNLFILDGSLKTVGKLNKISLGEKLYSARFMGNRAYLVTFKSVDPLFVIELKDSHHPLLLGQLKIPGFSDYLQPYDETHLIGFGKDVDPAETAKDQSYVYYTAVRGFKMALFDVADPYNPKELFKEIIGDQGTYSDLLDNHKALLFDKAKNLISFPITVTAMPKTAAVCTDFKYSTCPSSCNKVCQPTCTYENGVNICKTDCDGPQSCQNASYVYPKNVFVGAYVYGLDLQNGFKLKAKITHLDEQGITDLLKNGYADYEKTINRILYIGDTLYTVSQSAVKANSLGDSLRELNFVKLAESYYNITYGKAMSAGE